jgi:4-alpha-glucanotransferase
MPAEEESVQTGRASGILLHPTALPGPFGIGDLGPEAYRFVDMLAHTGQQLWQLLPLGRTGYGNSPYMCFSAYAGNPLLISLEKLVEADLLDAAAIAHPPAFPSDRVDYPSAIAYKMPLLVKSFQRFKARHTQAYPEDFYAFCQQHAFWLDDFALFMVLKEVHHGRVWTTWERGAAQCDPDALVKWRNQLAEDIEVRKYLQYLFFKQWIELRQYCHTKQIRVIGDLPIYVAHDSADVWTHRHLFHLDAHGNPLVVAGVPPDYFSATGQRWGNPLYRWEAMAQSGYDWWLRRFRMNFSLFDLVRLDHFRGFEAYWEIPATAETAIHGRWVKGPGAAFFATVHQTLGHLPVIAEDLGVITPEVDALRDQFNLPGMRILQMAFGNDPKAAAYRPHHHIANSVVYTATHDHNTTMGWFTAAPGTATTQSHDVIDQERAHALQYVGTDGQEIHWDFIRLALGSVAQRAVFPLQDVLGLGSEARTNCPGTLQGNWEWRFRASMLTPEIQARLHTLTHVYERRPE